MAAPSAYNLGKAGVKTLVIDKADGVGREASWAGAGILTSHASTRQPYPELCRASLALYPSLADELRQRTQIDIEFIQSGTLSLFFNEEERNGLIGLAERRIDRGFFGGGVDSGTGMGERARCIKICGRRCAVSRRCPSSQPKTRQGARKGGGAARHAVPTRKPG